MKRKLRSYSREELQTAIEGGARCVQFYYCVSLVHSIHGGSDVLVVSGWGDAFRAGFWYTFGTALLGWWGLHGIYLTPYYLYLNLGGGWDVTGSVLATLQSDAMSALVVAPEFRGVEAPAGEAASPNDFLKALEKENRRS